MTDDIQRLTILVLAYSISPVRGSEYSVGWNHVRELSAHHNLIVLYGLSGPHMGDVDEVGAYLAERGPMPNVRFVPVMPNRLARLLNAPNRRGRFVYSFYLAYNIWHRQAARTAAEIMASEKVDLVHYLCPIGYREPGYLWKLDVPYVWGPVGGMMPTRILAGAPRPASASIKTHLKNATNAIQLATGRRLRKALRRADILVASTCEIQDRIRQRFSVESLVVPENAIRDADLLPARGPGGPAGHDVPLIKPYDGPLGGHGLPCADDHARPLRDARHDLRRLRPKSSGDHLRGDEARPRRNDRGGGPEPRDPRRPHPGDAGLCDAQPLEQPGRTVERHLPFGHRPVPAAEGAVAVSPLRHVRGEHPGMLASGLPWRLPHLKSGEVPFGPAACIYGMPTKPIRTRAAMEGAG